MVIRDSKNHLPDGSFVLKPGDSYVLCAKNYKRDDLHLNEITMVEGDKWLGIDVKDLGLTENEKILMIKRNDKTIIPNGNTVIKKGDSVILYHVE